MSLPKVDRRLTAFATLKKRSPQSTWRPLLSAVPGLIPLRCSLSSGDSVPALSQQTAANGSKTSAPSRRWYPTGYPQKRGHRQRPHGEGSQGWYAPLGTRTQRRSPTVHKLSPEKARQPVSFCWYWPCYGLLRLPPSENLSYGRRLRLRKCIGQQRYGTGVDPETPEKWLHGGYMGLKSKTP